MTISSPKGRSRMCHIPSARTSPRLRQVFQVLWAYETSLTFRPLFQIVTFLPNWLREHDPVFRLHSNGATTGLIAEVIKHHHESSDKGEVMNNSLCKMTQTAMRMDNRYLYYVPKVVENQEVLVEERWSISHHTQNNTKDLWGIWDSNSLAVSNVHFSNRRRHGPLESVEFTTLSGGVKVLPSLENGDGLDLTRCVQYALQHKDKRFMFPDDFSKICDIIGRAPIQEKHLDSPTFDRWAAKQKADRKAARAARLAAPSAGPSKSTSSKVGQSRVGDTKDKVKKLTAKIEEAVQNGRLDLGDDGELILLDKPKSKVQPVKPDVHNSRARAHVSQVGFQPGGLVKQQFTNPFTQMASGPGFHGQQPGTFPEVIQHGYPMDGANSTPGANAETSMFDGYAPALSIHKATPSASLPVVDTPTHLGDGCDLDVDDMVALDDEGYHSRPSPGFEVAADQNSAEMQPLLEWYDFTDSFEMSAEEWELCHANIMAEDLGTAPQ